MRAQGRWEIFLPDEILTLRTFHPANKTKEPWQTFFLAGTLPKPNHSRLLAMAIFFHLVQTDVLLMPPPELLQVAQCALVTQFLVLVLDALTGLINDTSGRNS